MAENYEKVRVLVEAAKTRVLLGSVLAFGVLGLKDVSGTRDHLPEPLDVMDHAGNANISLIVGGMAGLYVGRKFEEANCVGEEKALKRKARGLMGLAGLVAGTAINAYVETRLGLKINPLFNETTPDLTDFSYGVIGAITGAVTLNKVCTTPVSSSSSNSS